MADKRTSPRLMFAAEKELKKHTANRAQVLLDAGVVAAGQAKELIQYLQSMPPALERLVDIEDTAGLLTYFAISSSVGFLDYPDEENLTDSAAKNMHDVLMQMDDPLLFEQRQFKDLRSELLIFKDWLGDVRADALVFSVFQPKDLVSDIAYTMAHAMVQELVRYDMPLPAQVEEILGKGVIQVIQEIESANRKPTPEWMKALLLKEVSPSTGPEDSSGAEEIKQELNGSIKAIGDIIKVAKMIVEPDKVKLLMRRS
jgi:hypothetical protein